MKYYRYMSITEFIKMMKGEEIVPIQTFENASTGDANGVCFLCEETKFDSYGGMITLSPEDCYQFLKRHLHDTSILVEFETNISMKETWGQYSSPLGEYFTDKTPFNPEYSEIKQCYGDDIKINEYRVDSYNVKTLKPTRFSIPQEMTYWNAFKYNLHLSDYDESLPNEIKWFEVGKELSLPKEVEEDLFLMMDN